MNEKSFLKKKSVTPLCLLAVAALVAVIAAGATAWRLAPRLREVSAPAATPLSPQEQYDQAVRKAMIIEPGDIQPLVEITATAPLCTWKNGKVLLLSWHSYPESYVPGQKYVLSHGVAWAFTDKEIISRFRQEKARGVEDWQLRLRQLIGVPPSKKYTHFSAMWTNPQDMLRPAYAWQLTDTIGADHFLAKPETDFKVWFDNTIVWSYLESAYPWTRLGYTYDRSGDDKKYGLSEFIIKKNAAIEVEFTMTTDEFIEWLEKR